MENGDLIVKYKDEQIIDTKLDKKIESFFETLGYERTGSGILTRDNIRDICFKKRS